MSNNQTINTMLHGPKSNLPIFVHKILPMLSSASRLPAWEMSASVLSPASSQNCSPSIVKDGNKIIGFIIVSAPTQSCRRHGMVFAMISFQFSKDMFLFVFYFWNWNGKGIVSKGEKSAISFIFFHFYCLFFAMAGEILTFQSSAIML